MRARRPRPCTSHAERENARGARARRGRERAPLHAIFPNAALGFGEVGLPRPVNSSSASGAQQIMTWAYPLRLALPGYIGGYFCWYGAEDALLPGSLLAEALRSAGRRARIAVAGCDRRVAEADGHSERGRSS
jgi:hypothetical protein